MRDPLFISPHEPEEKPAAGKVLPFQRGDVKNRKTRSARAKISRAIIGHAALQDENSQNETSHLNSREEISDATLAEIEAHLAETMPRELRSRAGLMYNVLSRLALRTAAFSSWLYDCQMNMGKGVRVVSHRLQLPLFPTGAPPLKVAFLSDLHYGPTTGKVANRQAWKLVRESNPDVILLGGDYLFADERGLPTFLRELQSWQLNPPPGGIFACLGNHDYYAGKQTIITTLEACGVCVLVNDAVPLPSPWKGVWVAGLDDQWHGEPDLEGTLARTSPDACRILLAHEPDICKSPLLRQTAITLSGHTHGGQICMPSGDPIYIPSKHGREYSSGLHRHAGQWLFVSRGVGTVGLPIRMFAPPDVAIFEFHGRANRVAR